MKGSKGKQFWREGRKRQMRGERTGMINSQWNNRLGEMNDDVDEERHGP